VPRRRAPVAPPELPPLTEEQEAVVEAVLSGQDVLVQAFAGAGKTTTLVAVAREYLLRHPHARIVYLTFNHRLLKEAQARLLALDASLPGGGSGRRIDAYTNHGIAFRHLGWRYQRRLLPSGSLLQARHLLLQEAGPLLRAFHPLMEADDAAIAVLEGLARFTFSADPQADVQHLPELLQLALVEAEFRPLAQALVQLMRYVWQEMSRPDDEGNPWPVTHDVYLKRFQLGPARLDYDLIMLDEAQDANPAMLDILLRQPAQKVFVGDEHQQVYAWRGAVNAMSSLSWPSYPLTVSWRFGEAIAAYASSLLRSLKGERRSIRGVPGRQSHVGPLSEADTILARSNVGALREALSLLAQGRRVAFAGPVGDLTDTLLAAYRLWRGLRPAHPELSFFRSWAHLLETVQRVPALANQYRPYISMVEEFGDEVPFICHQVRALVAVDDGSGATAHRWDTTLSTAHRAKGREWPSVRLAADWSWLPLVADDGWVNHEEANIAYVAVTRAIEALDPAPLEEALSRARERLALSPDGPLLEPGRIAIGVCRSQTRLSHERLAINAPHCPVPDG